MNIIVYEYIPFHIMLKVKVTHIDRSIAIMITHSV